MKVKTVLIKILFLFLGYVNYAQEIPKDTIYLEFIKNNGKQPKFRSVKFKSKKGLSFNLLENNGLINPNSFKSDTLCNKHLSDYKITNITDIDSLMKGWYKRNKHLLIKKYGKIHPRSTNKNNKFITYIIEKKSERFIIYRVFWRNQGI